MSVRVLLQAQIDSDVNGSPLTNQYEFEYQGLVNDDNVEDKCEIVHVNNIFQNQSAKVRYTTNIIEKPYICPPIIKAKSEPPNIPISPPPMEKFKVGHGKNIEKYIYKNLEGKEMYFFQPQVDSFYEYSQ